MKIKDLPIRGKIKFGAYSVNGEIPHKIRWLKAHGDSLFISEFLEDQCAFDAKEPGNEDNEYRRRYGNNRFSVSNVQQFINSDQVAWYHPAHEADAPPTGDSLVPFSQELIDAEDGRYENYNNLGQTGWNYLDTYSHSFTTPSGDKMVAFGTYGRDG